MIPVANVLADPTISVRPVAAFVEGNWGTSVEVLTKRPYRPEDVWTVWPAVLIKEIPEPGLHEP